MTEAMSLTDTIEELAVRIGPLRADWFEAIAASTGEPDYRAMLLRDDDPSCASIIAQTMLDQDALDIAELTTHLPAIIAALRQRGTLTAQLDAAMEKQTCFQRSLDSRDHFIVGRGLWGDYVDTLHTIAKELNHD